MKPNDSLLTPGEVASLLRVDPKTVTRWAERGLIESIKTPGGHNRFPKSCVDAILSGENINDATETGTSEYWQQANV